MSPTENLIPPSALAQMAHYTDVQLLGRVMRFLIVAHIVGVTPEGKCRANSITKSIDIYAPENGIPSWYLTKLIINGNSSVFGTSLIRLLEYLKPNGNTVPENANKGAFHDTPSTELHMFGWLVENKIVEMDALHQMMAAKASHHGRMWTDLIPEKWITGIVPAEEDSPHKFTIADVGASSGIVLDAFRQRLPARNVRLVLQDLPDVVEGNHHVTSMCRMTSPTHRSANHLY
ncbi:hypothetical protein N7522_007251 [Penicillium canescens]|nr:hypothetical protein N7522_007251 [Penicillium canescens]